MTTDVLSTGAFPIKALLQPSAGHSRGDTLTLRDVESMGGAVTLRATAPAAGATLSAGVVAADSLPLTITL